MKHHGYPETTVWMQLYGYQYNCGYETVPHYRRGTLYDKDLFAFAREAS